MAALATMAAILVAAVVARAAGGGAVAVDWVPAWGAELRLEVDGYAFLYLLAIGGVGLAVIAYSVRYLPLHLQEATVPAPAAWRFYLLMALFAVAMAGIAVSTDLLLLFLCWDATAAASYFLIGFDRDKEDARRAAFTTIVVTGGSAVLMLVGIAILWVHWGTFSLQLLFERAVGDTPTTVAVALILVAALAKSAQAPLHFWLPRAMVAPTPVSAYLHSAAMVAAGVLLIGRIHPLIELSPALGDALLAVGFASIALGGLLALGHDELKPILAYSTISQYGYVVVLYGLGGAAAAVAAPFYVLGHAIEKSALFLSVGAVGQSTGTERLHELGGLARRLPLVALASGVAAAALAGLPLTLGFFQDELLFKSAVEHGTGAAIALAAAAALTFAYLGRFWIGVFLGRERATAHRIPFSLQWPVLALAAVLAVGGVAVGPFLELAEGAGGFTAQAAVEESVAYEFAATETNLLAGAALLAGALLLALARRRQAWLAAVARLGERAGPAALWDGLVRLLDSVSDRIYELELRDLRTRVGAVLVPAAAFAALAILLPPTAVHYEVGALAGAELELAAALAVVSLAALAVAGTRRHLPLLLLLSVVGYGLAAAYAFFGAPDVALAAVLVETTLALVFFGVLALMPAEELRREARLSERRSPWRDRLIAVGAGSFAALVLWGGLSRPIGGDAVGLAYPKLVEQAHSKDAVTAILTDFRGLDTLGEVTVLAIALLGVAAMLRRGRLS